mmetsp:Transcript_32117/g.79501  ORF Transcript_32117/g.79501 Transcript_32117/m.79501 type:complete len:101 (-) Transcript_32117:628-930(-)
MAGLDALIGAFKHMPQLASLNLARNNLTNDGEDMSAVITLAAALKDSQITSLNLDDNQLCGIDGNGRGTFTTNGITALCDGIKQSKVSSLRCVGQICEHV